MSTTPPLDDDLEGRVLHIGDYICLFNKENAEGGFVFSDLSRCPKGSPNRNVFLSLRVADFFLALFFVRWALFSLRFSTFLCHMILTLE
jgi:hypothetical protein